MFEAIASFVQGMFNLWRAVKIGIAIGEELWDTDYDDLQGAIGSLFGVAHFAAWDDILSNDGLNNGQYAMALECRDAGAEYLASLDSVLDFDPVLYRDACAASSEGAGDALSQSIQKSSTAITHTANSTIGGLHNFLFEWNE